VILPHSRPPSSAGRLPPRIFSSFLPGGAPASPFDSVGFSSFFPPDRCDLAVPLTACGTRWANPAYKNPSNISISNILILPRFVSQVSPDAVTEYVAHPSSFAFARRWCINGADFLSLRGRAPTGRQPKGTT
jgi:hypothetical protein